MRQTIDATDKKLGRLASEVAVFLMGKNEPNFSREKVANRRMEVINISKLKIEDKVMKDKKYKSFSGYPSGLREEAMGYLVKRKGYGEIFRKAVYGMLPKNKLRSIIIKNLIIKE